MNGSARLHRARLRGSLSKPGVELTPVPGGAEAVLVMGPLRKNLLSHPETKAAPK
jgi:hypothetical protein